MADETPIVTPWYLDKAVYAKLFMPIAVMAAAYVNKQLGLPISAEGIDIFIAGTFLSGATFIAAHKWKTGTLQAAKIAAEAAVAKVKGHDPALGLAEAPRP